MLGPALWGEHGEHLPVCQQGQRPVVQLGQLGPQHQRRAEQAPQGHHSALLIPGQAGIPLPLAVTPADFPQGQHVAVRVAAWGHVVLPNLAPGEHGLQEPPVVPEIVGDAPHVGVLFVMPGFLNYRRPRRQGQHHGPARTLDGPGQHLDLMFARIAPLVMVRQVIGVAHVVALDEVHAPRGVKFQEGIIVSLALGAVPHAVHVRVPAADGVRFGHHIGGSVCVQDFRMIMGRLPGDAPHHVDAELEPQVVHVVCQRPKPLSACGGREPGRVRQQAGIFVHLHRGEGDVLEFVPLGPGPVGVPLDVHHHILPAEGLEIFRHHPGVGLHLFFVDGGVVVVVAVPPHGRGGGKGVFVHGGFPF